MWNLFKKKKKEDSIVSFPFCLLFSHRLVLDKLMAKDEITYEKALARVLRRGFDEYACELLEIKSSLGGLAKDIPDNAQADKDAGETEGEPLFQMTPVPSQRAQRPVQFIRLRLSKLKPGYIRCNNKQRKGAKYFYMNADDSARFAKAGYRFYKLTRTDKGELFLALFRSQEKDTHAISCAVMYEGRTISMRFHEKKNYSPVAALRTALGIEEEKANIRFVVREGQGCLLLQLFYDKDITNQPTNS